MGTLHKLHLSPILVHIADRVSELSNGYRERLYQNWLHDKSP
jgi:hypothetical protein